MAKHDAPFQDDPEDDFDSSFDDELEDDYGELEDELEDDELFDEYDEDDPDMQDELAESLAAYFAGDDFEVVDINWLIESTTVDPDDLGERGRMALEEAIARLSEEGRPHLPELAVFANVSSAQREQLHALWPTVPVQARRATLAALVDIDGENMPFDLSEMLRVAMEDEDAAVRRLGVAGLFDDAEPEFLGRLAQMARNDAATAVRAEAAAVLGNYVLAGELDELEPALAMRAEEALLSVLTDAGEVLEVKCRALESIAYSGEVGVRQLIEDAYYSEYDEMRLSSLTAMGRSADVRWRNLARAELSNPTPAIRAAAAYAVGELEARAALPELLELVNDEDETVRLAAIYALGHLGGREARIALQNISAGGGDEIEVFAADEALEEMAFYASAEAQSVPLYEEDGEDDEEDDWRFSSNADLGDYN